VTMGQPELLGWYEEELTFAASIAADVRRRLRRVFALSFGLPLLQWAFLQWKLADELSWHRFTQGSFRLGMADSNALDLASQRIPLLQDTLFGMGVQMTISTAIFAIALAYVVGGGLNSVFVRFRCQLLPATAAPSVRRLIEELRTRMGIHQQIRLYLAERCGVLPSVWVGRSRAQLIVTRQFIALAGRSPGEATAMLAHELGHVRQQDSYLWGLASLFANGFGKIIVPGMVLFIVASLATGGAVNLAGVVFLVWQVRLCREQILLARQSSEEMADLAAVVFADGQELINVLEKYVAPPSGTPQVHPPRGLRIDGIEAYMQSARSFGMQVPVVARATS
jgi:Zn-dependent protease with chaperone function